MAEIVWVPVAAKLVVHVALAPERTRLVQFEMAPPLSVKLTDPVKAPDPEVSVTLAVYETGTPVVTLGGGFGERARLVVPVVTVTVWMELVADPCELVAVTA